MIIDASTQELTKSTSVEGLEESYVHRFSRMPKVFFSLSLTCQISSSMHSKNFALLTNNPSPYEYEIK